MTKFLLQTFAIAGVRADLDKWQEEYDFYQKLWEETTSEYQKKNCEKHKEEAWENICACKKMIREIENYEFQRYV